MLDFGLYSGDPAQSLFGWEPRVSRLPFILLNSGSFAVCIFFVLSGFVLANSFSRTALSGPALAVKRYVRLTVPILCANLLAFAVFFMVPAFSRCRGADSLLHSAANFGRGLWFATVEALVKATVLGVDPLTYNGVLWTMNIEFIGSMILVLLFVSARRLGRTGPRHGCWPQRCWPSPSPR